MKKFSSKELQELFRIDEQGDKDPAPGYNMPYQETDAIGTVTFSWPPEKIDKTPTQEGLDEFMGKEKEPKTEMDKIFESEHDDIEKLVWKKIDQMNAELHP